MRVGTGKLTITHQNEEFVVRGSRKLCDAVETGGGGGWMERWGGG